MVLFLRRRTKASEDNLDDWFAMDLFLDPAMHKGLILEPWGTEINVESASTLRCIFQLKTGHRQGPTVPAIGYNDGHIIFWFEGDGDLFLYDGKELLSDQSNYPLPKKIAADYGV